MAWHLHVRFQETALRDAYWDQVTALPQLAPLLESAALRTRQYLARPVVAFEHIDRETLARLVRWTLDFWPSAQISLSQSEHSIVLEPDTHIYLETDPDPGR